MYSHIASNRRKTWLLIALFTGVLAAAGYVYGAIEGSGPAGLLFALVLSLGMTAFSWFAGDKVVLWSAGAKRIESREQLPYLWNIVENLCLTSGMPMPALYVIDDPAPNAFATGRDPSRASVAFTTGIIQLLENEELEGVAAHELSHIKNLDVRYMMLVAVMVGALTIMGDWFFRIGFMRRSGRGSNNGIFVVIGLVFLILSPIIGEIIKLAVSRRREYLADASGALLTRYPEGLARALEKISTYSRPLESASTATAHLWISSPFGPTRQNRSWFANLFSTHPPVEDRVKQLRLMADAK
ncbi:M48 family metallopeptidase [Candidatus Uhrbacteria bacterium]|nr:M48 family metallopeptidase [Candidatus Uhrbacteria bacterium]